MFEVNFNENTNIEKNIKTIKKDKKEKIHTKIIKIIIISIITMSVLLKVIPFDTITAKALLIAGNALIVSGAYVISEMIGDFICNLGKTKARKNLKEVANVLAQNKINTNAKELANSVILNNNKKTTIEISEDEDKLINTEEIKDKYYLFLDKDSNIQGILQRRTTSIDNDNNNIDNKYYILEQQDISKLETKVRKVKKLIRTKDTELEKQK